MKQTTHTPKPKVWEFIPAIPPRIGQRMDVRGQSCIIRRIIPLGTIEVESIESGQWFRVSGLPFGGAK